jgi:hypothetical protein
MSCASDKWTDALVIVRVPMRDMTPARVIYEKTGCGWGDRRGGGRRAAGAPCDGRGSQRLVGGRAARSGVRGRRAALKRTSWLALGPVVSLLAGMGASQTPAATPFASAVAAYVASLVACMVGFRFLDADLSAMLVMPTIFGLSVAFGLAAARRLALAVPLVVAAVLSILWSTAEPWTKQDGEPLVVAAVVGALMVLGVGAGLAGASPRRALDRRDG